MNEPLENDELLTEYLLGGLSETSRVEIEKRFFADERYEELLQAVEQELIYDYVQGGLTPVQRGKFEKRFLLSAEGRQQIEVARALLQRLSATSTQQVGNKIPSRRSERPWLTIVSGRWMRGPLAAIYAAAVLVLIAGVAWMIFSKMSHTPAGLQNQTAHHPSQTGSPNSQVPDISHPPANSQTATNNTHLPPDGTHTPAPQLAVLALTLEPGEVRDAGNSSKLILSPNAQIVRIQLRLRFKPGEQYGAYQAVLLNPDEKTVWTKAGLHSSQSSAGPVILLTVPAQSLAFDDYKIALSGQAPGGTYQDLADYYFSVRQR